MRQGLIASMVMEGLGVGSMTKKMFLIVTFEVNCEGWWRVCNVVELHDNKRSR